MVVESNAWDLIKGGHDVVVDALDNIETRLLIEKKLPRKLIYLWFMEP